MHFIDPRLIVYLAVAFVVLFFLLAFIGRQFGTAEGATNMEMLMDSASIEISGAFLSFGSLQIAIAYFLSHPLFALGGLTAWALWFVFTPRARSSNA